ncbi:glycosyltransferase family 1 protein [Cellulosilyticum sp. ST5]|uniref:glycosyltransferase family 4 protein n=1 Tax=unclassified Cellulosilyticum TaxID=2643091 RepID=UPI000F8D0FC9|nr:glycosyltransferase family 1 protein [Cellulosilyticum sp. WCF-2]QEH66970.1 glycosyltransferase family 4 protein [Cellulosilyticum sp. WCF-2]
MKIAIELQPCLKNRSGVGVYTYELSKRLQAYEQIELQGDVFNFLERNDLKQDLMGIDFNKETCKLFPYGVYRRIWHYLPIKYNQLFKREAQLTHFFNFIVPPRIQGKVMNTIYDLTFEFYPETMDKRNLRRIKRDLAYSLERPDKIITISEATKQDMIQHLRVDPSKIEVIYCGVDFKHFNEARNNSQSVREKYQLPDQYILYIGTLEPRKNIETLIEAFKRFKIEGDKSNAEIKLVLAGKKGWLYEGIFKKIQELGLEDDVVDLGYIDEIDKPALYQMAQCFVFPSIYEGFGIPVIEAMAAGTPVITTNVSSLPEVAGEAGLLVDPKDTIAIAESMYQLTTNEAKKQELIQKGYTQAQKFSWETSAEKLYRVYKELL